MATVSELVSKRIADTQANVRNWGRLVYNVREHGLVGDGVTDDTEKLQELIDLAISEGRKTIAFNAGVYYVTHLVNDDQVFFVGDNASFTGGYGGHIEQLGEMGVTQSEFDKHVAETVTGIFNVVTGYGADPTGVNDSAPAIQDAVDDALSTGRRGIVYIPAGKYLLKSVITIYGIDISIVGAGPGISTVLLADHNDGPVVRIMNERSGVSRLTIDATPERTSGPVGNNFGILHEAFDNPGALARFGKYEDLIIKNQPSHGMVMVAVINGSTLKRISIQNNLGHGLVLDNGTLTGRENKHLPGLTTLENVYAFDNAGHGICIGGENEDVNRGVRITMNNIELGRNALSVGVRKSADQAWIFADQTIIMGSAFSGINQEKTAATTRGILIAGRSNFLIANRFLDVTPNAIRVANFTEYSTKGCIIDEVHVAGEKQSPLDPVIVVDNGVQGLRAQSANNSYTTALVSTSQVSTQRIPTVINKNSATTVANSTTLVDDNALRFWIGAKQRVNFRMVLIYDGPSTAGLKVGLSLPSGASAMWGPPSGVKLDTSGDIVSQAPISSGTMVFGSAGVSLTRMIELTGQITTAGTAGEVVLQWAQNVADAGNTRIFGTSHLIVW